MGDTCSKTCGKHVSKDDIDLDYFINHAVSILYPTNQTNVKAVIRLQQRFNQPTQAQIDIENLPNGSYEFHLHEFGNLSSSIKSAGQIFSPSLKSDGKPLGELGKIEQKDNGQAIQLKLELDNIMLSGQDNILGRSIIIKQNGTSIAEGVVAISEAFELN